MLKKIAINSLTKTDAKTLRDIAVLEIIAWGRIPDKDKIEARISRLKQELERLDVERKNIFVAKKSDAIVGIGRVEKIRDNSDSWMLFGIAVHPEQRRQGVGEAIAQAGITFARSRGAKTIRSEAHADNLASIAFHKGIGFVEYRRFIAADGDDKIAFLMLIA